MVTKYLSFRKLLKNEHTGFKKILDALEANGSPKLEFETDEDRSYFITRLFVHEAFAKAANNDITKSTANSTPFEVVDSEFRGLELRNQILMLIQKNPTITKKQMSNILGVSMYALKKELAAMSAEHVAEFVGFSRNGKWVVY